MESLALVVSVMLLISILGAPLGWLTLKIPTKTPVGKNIKKIAAFILTVIALMVGVTILSIGPAIGGVVISLFSITSSIYVLVKIWRDKTYWER